MSKEKIISFFFGALSMVALILGMVALAWVAPTQPPPQQTVPAPLNVGIQAQAKEGPLVVANNSAVTTTGFIVRYGNVGIGTTTPQAKLDILSDNDNILRFARSGANLPILWKMGTDSTLRIVNTTTTIAGSPLCDILHSRQSCLQFSPCCTWTGITCLTINDRCDRCPSAPGCSQVVQETPLLTIDNKGMVGIGTTTPTALFHIMRGANTLLALTGEGKLGIGTSNPQRARLVIEDTVVSPVNSPWDPNSANQHAFGLMVYDPSPVATDKTLYNIEGAVKELGVRGSGTGYRIGVHGTVVNNAETDWMLAGSLAQMSGPASRAYGVAGYVKSCPSGYECFSGFFGSTNGAYPFAIGSGHLKILSQGAGIYFGGAYDPDTNYTRGGFLTFGDPGYSEDFIGYQGNKFYFRDSPGGGDTNHPTIWAGGYECPSDINQKENLEKLSNVLEKVLKINSYYFNWKDDSKKERQIGLVAQEVEKYFPELVSTSIDENGKEEKSLDYSKMVAVLLEAIKEQQKEIERLKVEISKLK